MDAKLSSYIDRKTASKLLGVSIRTVDRYIRVGRLGAYQENGRVWLRKREVINFPRIQPVGQKSTVDTRQTTKIIPIQAHHDDDRFYRDLYEETKRSLIEHQQKLQQTNYRIGQLESEIIHRPSANLDRRDETMMSTDVLRRELHDREREIAVLKDLVKRERASRIVFALLTYILLALMPLLWYLLR